MATTAGVLTALAPVSVLLALAVWIVVVLSTHYVSLGSITAAISIPIFILIHKFAIHGDIPSEILFFACLIGALIVFTHRSNIGRLLRGEENKFRRSRNPGGNS